MPSPVSPLSQALRLLQVQLTQARGTAQGKAAGVARAGQPTELAPQAAPAALQALRAQLRAARGGDGKLPAHKALRLFVQAALVDELGAELQLDPALSDLVERTCQALEQDPASATLLADALQELDALTG